jgi:tRNA(Arg) A34 adenosine deaminase TadA
MEDKHYKYMNSAIRTALTGVAENVGGPFGAVIVKNGEIIAEASNCVTSTNDPTAHAEVTAIRIACQKLGTFQLDNCVIYTTCEPCPMCLGAIYWARPKAVYYAGTKDDASMAGFDDSFIYKEIELPIEKRSIPFIKLNNTEAGKVFDVWQQKDNKIDY